MSRIDEKTVVPIGWVVGGFAMSLGAVVAGVLWISAVDYRLRRIEDKLGIPPFQSALSVQVIPDGVASENKN